MATEVKDSLQKVDLKKLATWTAVAAVISAVLNAILYVVTEDQFEGTEAMGQAFTIAPVIVATIVQIVLGGVLLAVLDRFLSRPVTVWMWIAIVFLVASLAQPFFLLEGEFTTTTSIILAVMHIIAGVITIFLLTTRTASTD